MKTQHIIFFIILFIILFRKRATTTTTTTNTVAGALTANALLERDIRERLAAQDERIEQLENGPLA